MENGKNKKFIILRKKTDFNWYSFEYGQILVTKLVIT